MQRGNRRAVSVPFLRDTMMDILKRVARVAKGALFFALLFVCVAAVSRLLLRKESLVRYSGLIDNPTAYDVIFLGNSHGVNAVQPMELWDDYGISAYNMCNYGNTITLSYWMLENAIACGARPRLVVLDVDDVQRRAKVPGSPSEVHTALDAFPLSRTKIAAIEDMMSDPNDRTNPDEKDLRYVDIKWEYYWPLGLYHERWGELGSGDLSWQPDIRRGGRDDVGIAVPNDYEIIEDSDRDEGDGFGYEYLQRLIATCRERGIDVLLTNYPFPAVEECQRAANTVAPIASYYGVGFLNFVSMDSVVDYRTDCLDGDSHLNPSGARKVTDFLGRYIAAHYDIPDRRGQAGYEQWDVDFDAYTAQKLDLMRAYSNVKVALMLLHDADLSAVIAMPRGSAAYENEVILRLSQNAARAHIYEEDAYSAWSDSLQPLAQLPLAASHGAPYLAVIDRTGGRYNDTTVIERLGVGKDTIATGFGALSYRSDKAGQQLELDGAVLFEAGDAQDCDVKIAVIDNRTGEVAAVMRFGVEREE